jgi:sorbitol-specific phosphotransferase system component IIC
MTKPASRKERSKITKVLLFPILAIFFLVGWSLYWIGQKEPKKPINKTIAKQKEELELTVISQEEQTLLS